MDGRCNSTSSPMTEPTFLDVKPSRTLVPLFPTPLGYTRFAAANVPLYTTSDAYISNSAAPGAPMGSKVNTPGASNGMHWAGETAFDSKEELHAESPPIDTPPRPSTGSEGSKKRPDSTKKRKRKLHKKLSGDFEIALSLLGTDGDRHTVERVLMIFDGLRRRLMQREDLKVPTPGPASQPTLEAGGLMTTNGLRVNTIRRVGAVPGVEVGDIFYFRFELSLIGLHSPLMAGIDYMNVKFTEAEEPIAISIVSAGLHKDDETSDTDILIYTGQGGISKPGKQIDNQKLEKGNLAMEKSLHRGNEIRVIRGMYDKGMTNSWSKIFMYDGLYKIQDTWLDKGKAGFSIFKYKLLRSEGQPEGIAMWKQIQQWKNNPSSRGAIILPDLSSGVEKVPVVLVNEIDTEKGPAHFAYSAKVKYPKDIGSMEHSLNCGCTKTCNPGDTDCVCMLQNGGLLSYTSNGLLVNRKPLIHECGSCNCSINCRNRVAQKGISIHLEVFKTKDRGWGLRSWDPIRASSFICEYIGEVTNHSQVRNGDADNDYIFEDTANTCSDYFEWNCPSELLEEDKSDDCVDAYKPLPICINAKEVGNVARFMNHSCFPNVFWQPVLYDHNDEHYPHIMFYALKHIPPMQELTYDYGLRANDHKRKKCLCGSSKCRGYFG